jgi:hypothetical protein
MTRGEYIEHQRERRVFLATVRLWGRPGVGDAREAAEAEADQRHARDMRRREQLGSYARGDR